jgi:hypothetical protein
MVDWQTNISTRVNLYSMCPVPNVIQIQYVFEMEVVAWKYRQA